MCVCVCVCVCDSAKTLVDKRMYPQGEKTKIKKIKYDRHHMSITPLTPSCDRQGQVKKQTNKQQSEKQFQKTAGVGREMRERWKKRKEERQKTLG